MNIFLSWFIILLTIIVVFLTGQNVYYLYNVSQILMHDPTLVNLTWYIGAILNNFLIIFTISLIVICLDLFVFKTKR